MDFFHYEDLNFESKKEDETIETIKRPTFLCHDVPELIYYITKERNLDWKECMLKFSIDKGHDKLKAGLNIIEPESRMELDHGKRARYNDGIAPSLHKSGSSNRMQLLAMVPSIQESYANLKILLENLPGMHNMNVPNFLDFLLFQFFWKFYHLFSWCINGFRVTSLKLND